MFDHNPDHRYESGAPSAADLDLARFDDEFRDMPVESREFEKLPDGKYQVSIDRVELTRSKTSAQPMLKWTMRVLAPKYQGRLLFRHNMIVTRENLKWLKADLFTCGLKLEKLSELPDRIDELRNVKLEVVKRTKGDFETVYLNRRIEIADPSWASSEGGDSQSADAGPVPF